MSTTKPNHKQTASAATGSKTNHVQIASAATTGSSKTKCKQTAFAATGSETKRKQTASAATTGSSKTKRKQTASAATTGSSKMKRKQTASAATGSSKTKCKQTVSAATTGSSKTAMSKKVMFNVEPKNDKNRGSCVVISGVVRGEKCWYACVHQEDLTYNPFFLQLDTYDAAVTWMDNDRIGKMVSEMPCYFLRSLPLKIHHDSFFFVFLFLSYCVCILFLAA